jgi:hypothetical protein
VKLLRPLYESWLFKATETGLSGWQRTLLARALRGDEALRRLALELAEFNRGPAPLLEGAPDLAPRLRALIADESGSPVERPLFPSGWVPAGAVAVLLITGWIALSVKPAPEPTRGTSESSAQAPAAVQDLAPPASFPALSSNPKLSVSATSASPQAPATLSKTAGALHPLTNSAK